MHADLIVDHQWELRLIGLRETESHNEESLGLQLARAFSIARRRGNYLYEPQSMFRRTKDGVIRKAITDNDPGALPQSARELVCDTAIQERLDAASWRRALRHEGHLVERRGHRPWREGASWGRAYSASPLDGSRGLFGELYPNADWNLGVQWPCIPLHDALDAQSHAALEATIRDEEEDEGAPVELFFVLDANAVTPLYRCPQRFHRTDAFVQALERTGRGAWRCVIPTSITESLLKTVDPTSVGNLRVLAEGMRAIVCQSACGTLATSPEQLGEGGEGRRAIYVCDSPSPELAEQLPLLAGVIAERANSSSHLGILLKRDGIPFYEYDRVEEIGRALPARTDVTIDGIKGVLYEGKGDIQVAPVSKDLCHALNSAQGRNAIKVYANADRREDAELALKMGARGIGLLRTEHLHIQPQWKDIVAKLLRGETPDSRVRNDLLEYQCHHLSSVFDAMGPSPVTVRFLDAPLHEFDATNEERNPMMGYRGVRALVGVPELVELQCRAVAEAWRESGCAAPPRLMVPLVCLPEEFDHILRLIRSNHAWGCADLEVGVMVETPRACFMTDRLVREGAQFLSFGTNDLTQFSWGLSRDDAAKRTLPLYQKAGWTPRDPFERLDTDGVGLLLSEAIRRARSVDPDIPVSVCGEQAADVSAIDFFYRAGVTGLSVAPCLVPQTIAAAALTQEFYR